MIKCLHLPLTKFSLRRNREVYITQRPTRPPNGKYSFWSQYKLEVSPYILGLKNPKAPIAISFPSVIANVP